MLLLGGGIDGCIFFCPANLLVATVLLLETVAREDSSLVDDVMLPTTPSTLLELCECVVVVRAPIEYVFCCAVVAEGSLQIL